MKPVLLAVGECVLRAPTASDAPAALMMFQDARVRQWFPGPDALSLESVRQWCLRSAIWSGAYAGWVIAGPDDWMLGNVLLWGTDREDQLTASVGYRLLASSRGRGIATAAVESVTSWAFEELGLERIQLPHSVANLDSCRVAQRCHYRLEGTQRGGYRDPAGRRWDAHVHARLRSDEVSR